VAQRIPIRLHVGNALQWLGTLYRNPADALKEHVSNAIDEHLKAKLEGTAHDRCDVTFTLDRRHVTIEYSYGMSRAEHRESACRACWLTSGSSSSLEHRTRTTRCGSSCTSIRRDAVASPSVITE
jgi:hypothetical protein